MTIKIKNSLMQKNFFADEFLQSDEWRKFQESVGRRTFSIFEENFRASIIEHKLPMVGKYFYVPRGPIFNEIQNGMQELVNLAKKNEIGWIRFDAENEEMLESIKNSVKDNNYCSPQKYKIKKAPHDMQPKEVFVIDITKTEEQLLGEMKAKTRYNIRLAEKKCVKIFCDKSEKNIAEFLRLTQVMAKRNGIVVHDESYYMKMLENIPDDILKLYVAEYQGKIIAANFVIFYNKTCIYLHGASDDDFRNAMAPHLLQWQQICDAKKAGCARYDFGGISFGKWQGITKFKLGFSPKISTIAFPGSYDIIINQKKYWLYRTIQKIKASLNFSSV
jgi:lipid II:glycine glycyltransferase (peptidoglycan interpeptide bridge formation enzyme)